MDIRKVQSDLAGMRSRIIDHHTHTGEAIADMLEKQKNGATIDRLQLAVLRQLQSELTSAEYHLNKGATI